MMTMKDAQRIGRSAASKPLGYTSMSGFDDRAFRTALWNERTSSTSSFGVGPLEEASNERRSSYCCCCRCCKKFIGFILIGIIGYFLYQFCVKPNEVVWTEAVEGFVDIIKKFWVISQLVYYFYFKIII